MSERDWRQDSRDLGGFCDNIKRKVSRHEPLTEAEQLYLGLLLDHSVALRHRQDFFSSVWRTEAK